MMMQLLQTFLNALMYTTRSLSIQARRHFLTVYAHQQVVGQIVKTIFPSLLKQKSIHPLW